jgi:ubiquinone/menaquinone biosynthesis C-methylase UbiE
MDYSSVTEQPGIGITLEALAMLHARYTYAARLCEGKNVLEVGCGAGMGLGLLTKRARVVVAGDYSERLLRQALAHYRERVPLVRLDAHRLPFATSSFDVVLLFEAIYYLKNPEQFLRECYRVLRAAGTLLLCLPNKEWTAFHSSPLSTRYFSTGELRELLTRCRFEAEIYGAFAATPFTVRQQIAARVRRAAIRLHLIPKTMKGKEKLKRLFYGKLAIIETEIEEESLEPEPLYLLTANGAHPEFKLLYVVARP